MDLLSLTLTDLFSIQRIIIAKNASHQKAQQEIPSQSGYLDGLLKRNKITLQAVDEEINRRLKVCGITLY